MGYNVMINIKVRFLGDDVDNLINIDHIINIERGKGNWDESITSLRIKDKIYSSPESFEAIEDKIYHARVRRNEKHD